MSFNWIAAMVEPSNLSETTSVEVLQFFAVLKISFAPDANKLSVTTVFGDLYSTFERNCWCHHMALSDSCKSRWSHYIGIRNGENEDTKKDQKSFQLLHKKKPNSRLQTSKLNQIKNLFSLLRWRRISIGHKLSFHSRL